jgi:hypothetical protein
MRTPTFKAEIAMPALELIAWSGILLGQAADSAGPAVAVSPETPPPAANPSETWQQRLTQLQTVQQVRQQQALQAFANRPTAWQLQNPSGAQNRFPTDTGPNGYLAPNTYFGPLYRDWSNLSGPVMLSQMPANYTSVPPVNYSNVPLAPNTYWGAANQSWSNVRLGNVVPNSSGGWTYRP